MIADCKLLFVTGPPRSSGSWRTFPDNLAARQRFPLFSDQSIGCDAQWHQRDADYAALWTPIDDSSDVSWSLCTVGEELPLDAIDRLGRCVLARRDRRVSGSGTESVQRVYTAPAVP